MFRHYRVILRELLINTLPSYTSISNAAVGNTIYNLKLFHIGFMLFKSQCLKSLNIKIILFIIKWAKINCCYNEVRLLWWLYIQSLC